MVFARSAVYLSLFLAGLLSACAQVIEMPEIGPMNDEPVLSARQQEVLARVTPLSDSLGTERLDIDDPDPDVDIPRAGDKIEYGITVTPELEAYWQATYDKDWQFWEEELAAVEASLPDTPVVRYLIEAVRVRGLIHAGRPELTFEALETLKAVEIEAFGDNMETLSQYGQVHFWLGEPDVAIGYYDQVIAEAGDWWVPSFYYAPPENTDDASRVGGAMIRSYIGLSGSNVMKGDYRTALAWAELGRERVESIIDLGDHFIYGLFVDTTAHMYEGYAWILTFLGAARVGVSGDPKASRHVFDAARAYFAQAGYQDSELVVDSIRDFVLYDKGLKEQETNAVGVLPEPDRIGPDALMALIRTRPDDLIVREEISLPIPPKDSVSLPAAGQRNSYNFDVTPAIAEASEAVLAGDGDAALAALERAEAETSEPLRAWYVSFFRAQTLIMMGRAADALEGLDRTAEREIAFFGTNLATRALRGEARLRLGEYEGAIRDFAQVVAAMGDWRAPTLFVFPPQIPQLSLMNRAQFRSYLGIAGALMAQGDYARAMPWAEAAEQLFEETFFSWNHELFRAYLKIDPDMYYGRGVNLGILGASKLVLTGDIDGTEPIFDAANAYFDALGYATGRVTVDAMRVRALIEIGRADLAEPLAREAAVLAVDQGLADLVWQIEALRGEILIEIGRVDEAEKALRNAQAALEAVSGALATDVAKRRFGIGKEDVTHRLVEIDIARGDMAALFRDLERGRARAFVDMLAARPVARGRQSDLTGRIRDTETEIRRQRLINSAPGRVTDEGRERERELLVRRDSLVAELRAADPELADAISVAAVDLSAIQRRLGQGDVLAYALSTAEEEAPIRFLVIDRNRTRIHRTDIDADELALLLEPFVTDDPLAEAPFQEDSVARLSAGLNLAGLGVRGRLYVVPSGDLYFMPWGALDIDVPVVVLPTGGWLARSPQAIKTAHRAGVVGDPVLGADWTTLPGAREEAAAIASLYGAEALIGAEATEAAVRRATAGGVGVLHLATHGFFDPRDPLRSAILLTDGSEAVPLTAAELFQNPLNAKLVVLSACETGLGTVSAGDDFLGLTRSFYLGGSIAVMNSLWPVHDKPTRLFMEAFHKAAAGRDYGRAWLKARDKLRDMGLPPSIYGAFVLGGAAQG